MNWTRYLRSYWPLVLALGIYSYLANALEFTQDDAYISYRYVANYLGGDGLVYNIGERVEGFTNFGWTIYMMLLGVIGANFMLLSKITGFLFGGGVVGVPAQQIGEDFSSLVRIAHLEQ